MFHRQSKLFDQTSIKPGDIIGFSGRTWLSHFINLVTYGIPGIGLSHVGIMANDNTGRLLLFESTTLDPLPCVIAGTTFDGTQAHKLEDVIRNHRGRVYHYPLYRPLYDFEQSRLTQFLMETIHTPYDQMGAMRSAGVGLSWIESQFREQDLTTIYCSEWCASALAVVGVLPSTDVSRWNPNHLARHLRRHDIVMRPRRLK